MQINNFKKFRGSIITGFVVFAVFMLVFWFSTFDSVSADSQSKCKGYCEKVEACVKSKPKDKKHECSKEIPNPDKCPCVTPQ